MDFNTIIAPQKKIVQDDRSEQYNQLISDLGKIEPDSLSPREALDLIYQLKEKLGSRY